MDKVIKKLISRLYLPPLDSHKGQNGKLAIIGGSKLFHGASLWALKTASRIVDMVFYSTVKENKPLLKKLKSEIYDFIYIPQNKIKDYIQQSDAVLIGPGMVSSAKNKSGTGESYQQTKEILKKLLFNFPQKKWIIDAGALQVMEVEWLKKIKKVIITPHKKEFQKLFKIKELNKFNFKDLRKLVWRKSREYGCVIVLKGKIDIICSKNECFLNKTGNPGMSKGGTGDVLAGLISALACKNDLFLAGCLGAYINGLAADRLFQKVGFYYNASDLCEEIPKTLKSILSKK